MVKDWLLKIALELAAKYLTEEQVLKWEKSFTEGTLIPVLTTGKDNLVAGLKAKAAETQTSLDDKAVDSLDIFLGKIIERLKA